MKLKILVCACLAMLAVLITRVITALTVSVMAGSVKAQSAAFESNGTQLGSDQGTLFYFVQISDIHISIFRDEARIPDLWKFCNENLRAIKPVVVVASGDLTDATEPKPMGSQQYAEEWRQYSVVIDKCRNYTTAWLDIRGNHDTFGVPASDSPNNYFRNNSAQGKTHPDSYIYTTRQENYSVSFVAVDGTVEPGIKKIMNFFGVIGRDEYAVLEKMKVEASKSNATFWFGHYPTSTLLSPAPGMREMMKDGIAYLNGHLHTFFMMVPKMHTIHHSGLMELELGDWKDHRFYRILAMDNGLFSFVDLRVNDWPAILITNPKESTYMQPTKEPLHKMASSTHIRVLLFSPSPITDCQWRIDDGRPQACRSEDGRLYVATWDPSLYAKGIHKLEVQAMNAELQTRTETITFSLDGSREDFTFGGRLVLMSDAVTAAQALFGLTFAGLVLPLCIFRIVHYRVLNGSMVKPRVAEGCCGNWLRRFWILSVTDALFYPLMAAMVYLLIGPWFIGELTEGHYGAVFMWGTIVQNIFQPGSLSYFYGFTHLLFFVLPLNIILAHRVSLRLGVLDGSFLGQSRLVMVMKSIPFFVLVVFQIMQAAVLYTANGLSAMLLSPLRLWSIMLAILLVLIADNLKSNHLASASRVWGHRSRAETESTRSEEELEN